MGEEVSWSGVEVGASWWVEGEEGEGGEYSVVDGTERWPGERTRNHLRGVSTWVRWLMDGTLGQACMASGWLTAAGKRGAASGRLAQACRGAGWWRGAGMQGVVSGRSARGCMASALLMVPGMPDVESGTSEQVCTASGWLMVVGRQGVGACIAQTTAEMIQNFLKVAGKSER